MSRKREFQDTEKPSGSQTVVDQHDIPLDYRPKKLRIFVREKSALTVLDDATTKIAEDGAVLRYLEEFLSDFLRKLKASDVRVALEKLFSIARSKSHTVIVLRKCLQIVQALLQQHKDCASASDLEFLCSESLTLKYYELDGQSLQLLFNVWCQLIEQDVLLSNAASFTVVENIARECTARAESNIRAQSLRTLVLCARKSFALGQQKRRLSVIAENTQEEVEKNALEAVLCRYAEDSDPRVRSMAVLCLAEMANSGWMLGSGSYSYVCKLLEDSCDSVRFAALSLLKRFADFYPEEQVTGPNQGVELRLVDDTFCRLCHAMNDCSVKVRTEAATLLGETKNVGASFLMQTLDKKLMSKMKFMKSGRGGGGGGGREVLQEWATGRVFGADAPVERPDEDSGSLIPSGACGAFVTGLEDEFMSVRGAAVRSLGRLAGAGGGALAAVAVDFLADMFNDEIEEVRLDAINCIQPLLRHNELKADSMETILNVLDDALADSRLALRNLLSKCQLASLPCLKMTVESLLNNIQRYPADKESVWECMKCLGRNHPNLVLPLVSSLLGVHPFFDTPEPMIENAQCLTRAEQEDSYFTNAFLSKQVALFVIDSSQNR